MIKRQLFRPILRVVLVRCLGMALAFLSSVVLARFLPVAEFGRFSYVMELVLLAGLLATLGLPQAIMRTSAAAPYEPDRTRNLFVWSAQVVCFSTLVCGAGLLLLVWLQGDPRTTTLVLISLPIVFLFSLTQVGNGLLWGQGKIELSLFYDTVLRPGLLLFFLLAVILAIRARPSATMVVGVNVAAYALTLLLLRWRIRPVAGPVGAILKKSRPPFSIPRNLPFFFILLIGILNLRLGTIALGIYRPFQEVAYFKTAGTLSALISFLFAGTNLVIAPQIAGFQAQGRPDLINHLTRRAIRPVFCTALLLFVVFALFGRNLLRLVFGAPFVAATVPLLILSCGQLFDVATGAVNTVLKNTGHQRLVVTGQVLGLASNGCLLLLLVPAHGAIGAALATSLGVFVSNTVNLFLLRRHTEFVTSIG
ncbi:MAG TPA: oligosaccharide flippase family protein [Candidatus Aminicenantes bacterium]|nr:oligosaccharide flippase family protein [Candidatus Aminicenantes bacterium]